MMPRSVAVVQSHLATRWTILAKLFFGSAVAEDAMRCFGYVRTVSVYSVVAAHSAACRHAGNNGGPPTAVVSGVPRDEQIIATGSASTGIVAGESRSTWQAAPTVVEMRIEFRMLNPLLSTHIATRFGAGAVLARQTSMLTSGLNE